MNQTPETRTFDLTDADEGENNSREYIKEALKPIKHIVETLESELVMGELRTANASALVTHLTHYVNILRTRTDQVRHAETERSYYIVSTNLHNQGVELDTAHYGMMRLGAHPYMPPDTYANRPQPYPTMPRGFAHQPQGIEPIRGGLRPNEKDQDNNEA